MSAITEKYFLLRDYKDYINIFLKQKVVKFSKLEDTKYLINFISGKNLFYELIYNLSTQELKVLQKYLNSALNKK